MKTIICIVGKTGRGKDTLARQINKRLGIHQVCSYTTRPKRDCEVEGREHYFITPEQAEEIKKTETLLAYAHKPSGVEYFATLEKIDGSSIIYVIDPEGIEWMRDNIEGKGVANLFIVELYANDKDIEPRIKSRGDNWEAYCERIENEREEFENFHLNGKPDVSIDALLPIDEVYEIFRAAYISRDNNDTFF